MGRRSPPAISSVERSTVGADECLAAHLRLPGRFPDLSPASPRRELAPRLSLRDVLPLDDVVQWSGASRTGGAGDGNDEANGGVLATCGDAVVGWKPIDGSAM